MAKHFTLISVFIIVAGFAGVFLLSRYAEANKISLPESYSDSDLDLQGGKLKGFALGAEGLLADWYWMRSLQYIGGKILKQGIENTNIDDMESINPRLLHPMLDTATTLDPKLMAAYSYGATVLPAIDEEKAIALTEKGIANNPERWRLLQHLGYIHWVLKDYQKAADAYERGANVPGSPPFFRLMMAKMRADSGSRETARTIYSQMYAEAPDNQTKLTAELRLKQMDALDDIDVINPVLAKHRETSGGCASTWAELLPALQQASAAAKRDLRVDDKRNVVDPTGVPYRISREKCVARIDFPTSKIPVN